MSGPERSATLRRERDNLRSEVELLRSWIEDEGERNLVCTFHVLRKVCHYCQCPKKEKTI